MKENEIGIQNNSGDRKYFTTIPNCVVNGSTGIEQSLYLQMKRYSGEKGFCFVSIRTLAKKLGVSHTTIVRNIHKLLERKWIKKEESHYTGGRPANCYSIADIWKYNIDHYEEEKIKKKERKENVTNE